MCADERYLHNVRRSMEAAEQALQARSLAVEMRLIAQQCAEEARAVREQAQREHLERLRRITSSKTAVEQSPAPPDKNTSAHRNSNLSWRNTLDKTRGNSSAHSVGE
jgi:hypothetical protein